MDMLLFADSGVVVKIRLSISPIGALKLPDDEGIILRGDYPGNAFLFFA
jgi:hypothetical protein